MLKYYDIINLFKINLSQLIVRLFNNFEDNVNFLCIKSAFPMILFKMLLDFLLKCTHAAPSQENVCMGAHPGAPMQ